MNQIISKENLLKIKAFFNFLEKKNIENYIISNLSEFDQSVSPDFSLKIKILSGFESSNAFLIFNIAGKKLILVTDGRYEFSGRIYFNQEFLKKEANLDFEIFLMSFEKRIDFLSHISFEPKFFNQKIIGALFDGKTEIKLVDQKIFQGFLEENNLNESSFEDQNLAPAFLYDEKYSGENSESKIERFFKAFEGQNKKMTHFLISDPISLNWLFNFRGFDVKFVPVFLCFGIADIKNQKIEIFCQKPELITQIKAQNLPEFQEKLETLKNQCGLSMSPEASFFFLNFKDENLDFLDDPTPLLMSKKNEIEIDFSKKAHQVDGLALSKLFLWLEKQEADLTEVLIADKLLEFKKESALRLDLKFFSESFETISGFEENGAIIHYHPDRENPRRLEQNGLLLLDSGSHYFGATTDITRIFLIKNHKPSVEQIKNYTICLKTHLSIFLNRFDWESGFAEISQKSYEILERNGLSCPHSIGHGVSNFLSVHEKPFSINKNSKLKIDSNLILSNEPGVYFPGKYGIRIENLMISREKSDGFFEFENLTSFFYEPKLIDFGLLDEREIKFIKVLHLDVFEKIKNYLNPEESFKIFEHFVDEKNFLYKSYDLKNLEIDLKRGGFEFLFFKEIDSTQTKMIEIIQSKKNVHRQIILASSQSKGKGKGGNLWKSDFGGIYFTASYDFSGKKFDLRFFPQISLIAGFVISEIIEENLSYFGKKIQIKWPNDVLVDQKKICGILPEIFINHLIIGVGINFFENHNILNDNSRDHISNLVSIEFHRLIFEIIQRLYKILDEFFESGEFAENFIKFKIIPKVDTRLLKESKLGLILNLLEDGSVNVLKNDQSIENFKSALDFEKKTI